MTVQAMRTPAICRESQRLATNRSEPPQGVATCIYLQKTFPPLVSFHYPHDEKENKRRRKGIDPDNVSPYIKVERNAFAVMAWAKLLREIYGNLEKLRK